MTLDEYRIHHSMLIEQYQWVEFNLEDLYAVISDDPFCQAIREIEKDSIGGVVREIRKLEKEKNIVVFSESEYKELDALRERRNFWTHVCYTEAYDKTEGVPRNAQLLAADLERAEGVLTRLRQIKDMYMIQNHKKIIDSLFCQ